MRRTDENTTNIESGKGKESRTALRLIPACHPVSPSAGVVSNDVYRRWNEAHCRRPRWSKLRRTPLASVFEACCEHPAGPHEHSFTQYMMDVSCVIQNAAILLSRPAKRRRTVNGGEASRDRAIRETIFSTETANLGPFRANLEGRGLAIFINLLGCIVQVLVLAVCLACVSSAHPLLVKAHQHPPSWEDSSSRGGQAAKMVWVLARGGDRIKTGKARVHSPYS